MKVALRSLLAAVVAASPALSQRVPAVTDLTLDELAKVRVIGVSKVEESVTGAPASVTVFTSRDMARMGWRTVAEVLDASPGMLTTSSAFVRFAPAIRGDIRATGGVHVLVLLDGRPLRGSMDALSSQDLFARIPVAMLDRIEVIRGPGSVLYGTNALAGVINLVTRRADASSAQVEGSVGSFNSRSVLVQAMRLAGDARFSLTAQVLDDPELVRRASDLRGTSREVTLPARTRVLYGSAALGDASLDVLYTDWNGPSLRSRRVGMPNISFWAQELAVNGAVRRAFSERVDGQLNLDYTGTRAAWDPAFDIRPVSNDALIEGTLLAQVSPTWHLLAGAVANQLTGNAIYLSKPSLDYRQWTSSAYVQADFRPTDRLRLMLGGQAIHAPTQAVQVVPRAAFVYEGANGVAAKLVFGEAFRAPSAAETDLNQPPALVGNPALHSERVRTAEAVISLRGARGEAALSLFDSRQRDLITSVVFPGSTSSTYINRGHFNARGAELEGHFVPAPRWTLLGSLSIQHNTLDDSLHNVGRAPLALARFGASWTPRPALTMSVFDNWLGAAPPLTRLFPAVPSVNPPSEAYHLVSAHAALSLGGGAGRRASTGATATLRVDNLLDQETWVADATIGAVNTLPWRPGRVITLGLRFDWSGR